MFIRLYPNQLKPFWPLINETFDKAFPESAMVMKTALLKDLMLETAICWLSVHDENDEQITDVVFITKLNDDYAVGRKTVTIVAAYAPNGSNEQVFLEGFEAMKKYAASENCSFFDFYTDNPRIIHYAEMFNPFWRSDYFQMKISD